MTPNSLDASPFAAVAGAGSTESIEAPAHRLAPELAEIAEAACFPEENPNPVFRVAADGRLLYANRASRPLLATWGVDDGGQVPPPWLDRIASVLAAGETRNWDAPCADRLLQLHYVPILAGDYVNVYGADVTERSAALEAGRVSDARYRLLFDSIDTGFCVIEVLLDGNGKPVDYVFLETNPAFEAQTGLANAIGRGIRDMVPLHEEHWFETYGRVASTGEPARFENEAAQLGRHYDVYAFRIGDPAERKVAVLFGDITLRKQAEAERGRLWRDVEARNRELEVQAEQIRLLNASLEQRVLERTAELEAIIAGVPDALYVSDETRVLRCNQATLDAFGCESLNELNEKRRELVSQMLPRYADTGQPIPPAETERVPALRGQRAAVEMTILHRPTQQDRTYRVAAAPVILNGQTVAAVAVATDITERKRNELELAYQANLLANVSDAVIATDPDYRITSLNRAAEEMFGWPQAEARGRPIQEVLPSRFVDTSEEAVNRELSEGRRWQGEIMTSRRDGTPVLVEATAMPLRNETGGVTGFVTVNRDITEHKKADDEIRASREQLQALSRRLVTMQEAERSYVADQLYNQAGQVLAALQMQLSRLGREGRGESPAEQLPHMQAMLQQAIGELHDLARELRPVGLDRSTLARVLAAYLNEFGEAHGLAVEFEAGGAETLRVPADVGTAIFRCAQEGLTNVARHARASQVVLSLAARGDNLVVTLADNGVGLGARVDSDERRRGLGLAAIRERLEIVGGEFTILSSKSGTTLTMQAPMQAR